MNHTPSLQLITDAVVAQYIHDISERHRSTEPETDRPQDRRSGTGAVHDAHRMFV